MVPLTFLLCVLLFGCFVKGSFNTQRGVKNLIGQFGVLHPLHPQCGCSSEKMCEQRTWTVCCFLLGPKPITLESIQLTYLHYLGAFAVARGVCTWDWDVRGAGRFPTVQCMSPHFSADREAVQPGKRFATTEVTMRIQVVFLCSCLSFSGGRPKKGSASSQPKKSIGGGDFECGFSSPASSLSR